MLELQRAEIAHLEIQHHDDKSVTLLRNPLTDIRSDLRECFSVFVHSLLGDDRANSLLALKGGDRLLGASDWPTSYRFLIEELDAEAFRYRVEEEIGERRKILIADARPLKNHCTL